MNPSQEICKAFSAQAHGYEQAAKVQTEIGQRLLSRLDYIKINPKRILDLGAGPGLFSAALSQRFPEAQLVSLDISMDMLKQLAAKPRAKQCLAINADMQYLPFADASFDLVFANQSIHWAESIPAAFEEIARVMAIDACLLFSSLGPDSLIEIRQAFAEVDQHAHTMQFADMHDLGDALLKAEFLDPVMDMEKLELHYQSPRAMLRHIKQQGVRNMDPARNPGLTGRGRMAAFEQAMRAQQTADGPFPLSYEVLYGHAWKGAPVQAGGQYETFIPISRIGRASKF